MATWDELRQLTWEQLKVFNWGEVARLTADQIGQFTEEIWPVLASMSPEAREDMLRGLLEGALPPALLASAETEYTESQVAALSLWTRYAPHDSATLAAWVAVLLALLQILGPREPAPTQPPDTTVVIIQLPVEVRPLEGTVPGSPEAPPGPGPAQPPVTTP